MILRQILESYDTLVFLSSLDIKMKTSMKLAKIISDVQPYVDAFNSAKQKIISKYGIEVNGVMTIPEENKMIYVNEINDAANMEIDISSDISQEEFNSISDSNQDVVIKPERLVSVNWIIAR